mmetsp:Transcript_13015/g.48707  ORF Transcript_13015/g.48707 Transcript_13015/m.48707 type:complete len:334 (-) Transcript_13015:125-1126(-)
MTSITCSCAIALATASVASATNVASGVGVWVFWVVVALAVAAGFAFAASNCFAAAFSRRTAACRIHHSGWNLTRTGVLFNTTCAAAVMKQKNPPQSVYRSQTACLSSLVNIFPPPKSAKRCSPSCSSFAFFIVTRLCSIRARVNLPFSSSSPIIARLRRRDSVLCCARFSAAVSLDGGLFFSLSESTPTPLRGRPSPNSSARALLSLFAGRTACCFTAKSRSICRIASRAAIRSASASRHTDLTSGRTCSSANCVSSRSSLSSRARPALPAVAGSTPTSPATPTEVLGSTPLALRSASAKIETSNARINFTRASASGGSSWREEAMVGNAGNA